MGKIMNDQPPLTNLSDLTQRLQELHQRTRETPLFNPVFQLAHDFSRALEGGEVSLDGVEELVDAVVINPPTGCHDQPPRVVVRKNDGLPLSGR